MSLIIINLTQHQPTAEQEAAGVTAPGAKTPALLTFTSLPTPGELEARAQALAEEASKAYSELLEYYEGGFGAPYPTGEVLVGGAPYLMAPLEGALRARGLKPVYSFSERVSEEVVQPDGSVRKTNVFRHVGFVGGDR